jgi:hypothetical protein
MPPAIKFDFFPAAAFPHGFQELDRAVCLAGTGLSGDPAPFVTPDDILPAKLYWFRAGGEVSEVPWRDMRRIVRGSGASLDHRYLEQSATKLGAVALHRLRLGCLPHRGLGWNGHGKSRRRIVEKPAC